MKQENKYKSQRKERKLVPGHKISTLQKYQEVDSKYLIPFLHKLPSSFITMWNVPTLQNIKNIVK
jgi:hypothetical protein